MCVHFFIQIIRKILMCVHEDLNFYPASGSTTPETLTEITVGCSLSLFSFFAAAFSTYSIPFR